MNNSSVHTLKMSLSSSYSNADIQLYLKSFIEVSREYNRTRTETCTAQLNRCLQHLGFVTDSSIFIPNNNVIIEFYVSLQELLFNVDHHSCLLWEGIKVLEIACKNPTARYSLIHTYNFLPILSRVLNEQQSRDKKERLLKLIQEITYGIQITWQEPHIPHLISILVKWTEKEDVLIVNMCLGVLINLCYKNLPAIYTLIRCTDINLYLRTLTNLKESNVEVQVGKLFIILEQFHGEVSKESILRFIQTSFKSVTDAFQKSNFILLRHIVDFYIDIKELVNQHAVFSELHGYISQVERLLQIADVLPNKEQNSESNISSNCTIMLFEFLQALVQMNLPEMFTLYPQLLKLSLNWIYSHPVSSHALSLIYNMVTADESKKQNVLQQLSENLPIFFTLLDNTVNGEFVGHSVSNQTQLVLMFLFREMMKCELIRPNVLIGVKEESIRKIFIPLFELISYTVHSHTSCMDNFSNSITDLYINTLALVEELSMFQDNWKNVYFNLLEQKQIHMVIANALYKGEIKTKALVLNMAKSLKFPNDKIASAFCELQSSVDFVTTNKTIIPSIKEHFSLPIIHQGQQEKLNALIYKLQEALSHNQTKNILSSEILELYEYKIAMMNYAEKTAQLNLEAAGKQIVYLQHRIAQMSIESSKLHQLLIHVQRCQENTDIKLSEIQQQYKDTVNSLGKSKNRCTELNNQLSSAQSQIQIKINLLKVQEEKHANLLNKYQEVLDQKNELELNHSEQKTKNNELCKVIKKMEERLHDFENKLEVKSQSFITANQKIESLKEDIENYEKMINRNKELLAEKDKECQELQTDLSAHKSKLEWIMQISMNTLKSNN